MLTVSNSECHIKAPYAEYRYAEYRYAECRVAAKKAIAFVTAWSQSRNSILA